MRVIQTPPPDIDVTTLEAFRHHLVKRDLAPATVTAYLNDINRFWTWLGRGHGGHPPPPHPVRFAPALWGAFELTSFTPKPGPQPPSIDGFRAYGSFSNGCTTTTP